jgi:UDP-glucose 4-epimerase
LVTGGAGFIGSHVAAELLQLGHCVVCLDNLAGGSVENVPARAEFFEVDIRNEEGLRELFAKHSFDYVFHLAAFAAEGLSHFVRQFTFANNVVGTSNLINAAINSQRMPLFVFASSVAVYGKNTLELCESTPPTPVDPYGISKMASELDLRAAADFFGLRHIIFRLHNVYGERQNLMDQYRNVVAIFARQLLEGKPLSIYGKGLQARQFTHVADVARILARAVSVPSAIDQVFNLGNDESHRVIDLAKMLSAAAGVEFQPVYLPERNEASHPNCSHEKARTTFEIAGPTIPLQAGLERMYRWALNARRGRPHSNARLEVRNGFPSNWSAPIGL